MMRRDVAVIFLLFIPLPLETFIVLTPNKPVLAVVGRDVVLDCQLVPVESLEEMEVRWFRLDWSYVVHLYRKGQDWPEAQNKQYQGRTKMFKDLLDKGNVSLLLTHVTVQDNGKYKCFVVSKTEENENSLQLNVASVGQEPVMKMVHHQGNGIKLSCFSEKWFPAPRVEWRDSAGVAIDGHEEKVMEDSAGFLMVESTITVQVGTPSRYSCHIRNQLVDQEQEGSLEIADVFFPQTSSWMVAFWIIFIVLLASAGVIFFFYHLSRIRQRRIKELLQRPTVKEYDDLHCELVKEQSRSEQEKEILLQKMEQEKLTAQSEYTQLLHSTKWDKMMWHAVTVRLDPETANGCLEVSNDRTSVCDRGSWHDATDSPARFDRYPFILGTNVFEKGKHYWEVSVEGCPNWDVGVVRMSANHKGKITLCPEQGFWCFGLNWDNYEAKDKANIPVHLEEKPTRVGIFLNLNKGNVSFHDAGTKQQLFAFQANFQEPVYPFFCPWRSREPLQIIPVVVKD